jgi:O-antigen/teichoic acid export membrane protein
MLIANSIIYVLARLVPGVLMMATTAVLTRLLEPGSYGLFALAQVIMMLVSNIAFDWLDPSLQRLYEAHHDDPRTFITFAGLFLSVAVISGVIALLAWLLGGFGESRAPIYLLGVALAWSYSWFELVSQFEIVNFRSLRYLRMNLGRAVLVFAGTVGAALVTRDPFWTAAFVGAGLLGGAMLGSLPSQWWRRRFNWKLASQIIRFGLPLVVSIIMFGLVTNGTRAMLEVLDSSEALGQYTAAYTLVQYSLIHVGNGVGQASYILAVRAVEKGNQAALRRQLLENGTLLIAVMAPACLGLALVAQGFVTIMLGPQFRATAILLTPWMAAGAFFASLRMYYFDHAFHLGRRTGPQIWVASVSGLSAIALSFVLIPRMGAQGAAISVTAAMAISCCHSAVAGRRIFRMPIPLAAVARVGACCTVMAGIVLLIPLGGSKLIIQIALAAASYCAAALAMNVLNLRARALALVISYKCRIKGTRARC